MTSTIFFPTTDVNDHLHVKFERCTSNGLTVTGPFKADHVGGGKVVPRIDFDPLGKKVVVNVNRLRDMTFFRFFPALNIFSAIFFLTGLYPKSQSTNVQNFKSLRLFVRRLPGSKVKTLTACHSQTERCGGSNFGLARQLFDVHLTIPKSPRRVYGHRRGETPPASFIIIFEAKVPIFLLSQKAKYFSAQ